VDEYAKEVWRIHFERINDTLMALKSHGDWKLFLTYFDLADWAGHLYPVKGRLFVLKAYLELNRLAGFLKRMVEDDATVFLIMSDHGYDLKINKHSKYAFWSLNIDVDWAPQDFTDYYSKILEWIRM